MSDLTLFICGPRKDCQHDYSGWEDLTDDAGKVCGGTAICTKCGASAIAEDMWRDDIQPSFGAPLSEGERFEKWWKDFWVSSPTVSPSTSAREAAMAGFRYGLSLAHRKGER